MITLEENKAVRVRDVMFDCFSRHKLAKNVLSLLNLILNQA